MMGAWDEKRGTNICARKIKLIKQDLECHKSRTVVFNDFPRNL